MSGVLIICFLSLTAVISVVMCLQYRQKDFNLTSNVAYTGRHIMEADSQPPIALYDTIEKSTTKSSKDVLTKSVTKGTGVDNTTEVLQSSSEAPATFSFREVATDVIVTEENVAYISSRSSPLVCDTNMAYNQLEIPLVLSPNAAYKSH